MSKKLVRSRRVQERELRRGWRHGERRAAGAAAVSDGAAKLRATSDVSFPEVAVPLPSHVSSTQQ